MQALLDALKNADQKQKPILEKALNVVKRDLRLQKATDQIIESREYDDDTIKFTKVPTYEENPEIFKLDSTTFKVLMLMQSVASQSGFVRLSQSTIHDITGFGRPKIQAAIEALIKCNYISVVIKPPKGTKQAPTYLLDRRLFRNGHEATSGQIKLFEQLKDNTSRERKELEEKTPYYKRTKLETDYKGSTIEVATLEKREKPSPYESDKANTQGTAIKTKTNHTTVHHDLSRDIDQINRAIENIADEIDSAFTTH